MYIAYNFGGHQPIQIKKLKQLYLEKYDSKNADEHNMEYSQEIEG